MKRFKLTFILIVSLLNGALSQTVIPERCGWWKFDNAADLNASEPGYGLELNLTGTHSSLAGPEEGNGAVLIQPGSYYTMRHGISIPEPEKFVNEYSLLFDFQIPESGVWRCFFQTGIDNHSDGEFFINPSGNIGVAAVGYSSFTVHQEEWYRLLISVKNGNAFTCYLDGALMMIGNVQSIDGRFSLDSLLLIFADDNGEDGVIHCAELSIWNQALDDQQARELGGYGHHAGLPLMTRIPFLQSPGRNSMVISWHDTSSTGTIVEYGLDSSLNFNTTGSSELINPPYRWHTVGLSGLEPGTRYFYRVKSGNGKSVIYSFKTLPEEDYSGKIRFLLLSDTHASDTTMAGMVLRTARAKIAGFYGPDIENHLNGIFHSGDITVSGNSAGQYTSQFFQPLSVLSANLPTMTVAGNHEGESPFFYGYMKLDGLSAYPLNTALNERIWQLQAGNSLFIGLNTNITSQFGNAMSKWLDGRLSEVEADPGIDFVFLFFHHPPFSELWFDVSTFDAGADYVRYTLFPVFKKYTKVQEVHTGHTHGFERGTILSPIKNADFRIICGGGGGGPLDTWGAFTNLDYEDIHIAYDHYCFQILEIDIAGKSYRTSMFSLGDLAKPRDSELLDTWYKKINQAGPDAPVIENIIAGEEEIRIFTSEFSGTDSLMSVELQVSDPVWGNKIVLDTMLHWKNIYGVDNNLNPIDKNKDQNLYQPAIKRSSLEWNKSFEFRVRYRDHNLKWSEWSASFPFSTVGIMGNLVPVMEYSLHQNYPNPFQEKTRISYSIPERTGVKLGIYDIHWRQVADLNEGIKNQGRYHVEYNGEGLHAGVYYYMMTTDTFTAVKRMMKIM